MSDRVPSPRSRFDSPDDGPKALGHYGKAAGFMFPAALLWLGLEGVVRLFLAITTALILGGCAVAQHMDDQSHYQQSLADYRACVAANNSNPGGACEAKRLLLETDQRAAENSKITTNPQNSYDITVRNR